MLAVLRGELAATSFGGEVYLAALFFAFSVGAFLPPSPSPYQVYGFRFGRHRLHPPEKAKKRTAGFLFRVSEMGGHGAIHHPGKKSERRLVGDF